MLTSMTKCVWSQPTFPIGRKKAKPMKNRHLGNRQLKRFSSNGSKSRWFYLHDGIVCQLRVWSWTQQQQLNTECSGLRSTGELWRGPLQSKLYSLFIMAMLSLAPAMPFKTTTVKWQADLGGWLERTIKADRFAERLLCHEVRHMSGDVFGKLSVCHVGSKSSRRCLS